MTTLSTLIEEARALVEVSSHERCPDGSHWNDADHKCKELPPELLAMHKKADDQLYHGRLASNHADEQDRFRSSDRGAYFSAPASAKSKENHAHAAEARSKGHALSNQAASALHKAGFHDLARKHDNASLEHSDAADFHAKRASV